MKRKAIIYTFLPGLETKIKLCILIQENGKDYIYKGFYKYYPFYDIEKALSFARRYTDIIEIKKEGLRA